jgi:hypothetical protein
MTHYPALLKAAAVNAGVILDVLEDGARPTLGDLRRACAADGYADELSVDIALRQLIDDGYVVRCETHGHVDYALALGV